MNNTYLTEAQRNALAGAQDTAWGRRLDYTVRPLTVRALVARELVSEWGAPAPDAPGGNWITPAGEELMATLPVRQPGTSCSGAFISTPCSREATFALESTIHHPDTGATAPGHRLLACTQHMGRVADRLRRELPQAPVAVAGSGLFLAYSFTALNH